MTFLRTLIKNGRIIDGSGQPAFLADLLLADELILAVLPKDQAGSASPAADQLIDAKGLTLTPGFIDGHRHGDLAALTDPDYGHLELAQGITSVVNGNCGMSLFPTVAASRQEWHRFLEPCLGRSNQGLELADFATYAEKLAQTSPRLNVANLVGTGAVRTAVKGMAAEPFTQAELVQAARLLDQALTEGALGVSAGIMYVPECYTSPAEYAAILEPAAKKGALLSCHVRGEGDGLVDSIREIVTICQKLDLRLNISHFKSVGIKNWQRLIHAAITVLENSGLDFSVDFYPYLAGSTTLLSLLPPVIMRENLAATLDWLDRPAGRDQLRRELAQDQPGWDNHVASVGWDRIILSSASSAENEPWLGKSITEIATAKSQDPVQVTCDLLSSEKGNVTIITRSMDQTDLETIARLPWAMLVSDALYGGSGKPHPRLYGAFPRAIRQLVFAKKILSLEEVVYKMTGLPAQRHGLKKRGLIKPGYFADLNIFDPAVFTDQADYKQPRQLAVGLEQVLVNGVTAYADNQLSSARNGHVLKRS